MQIPGANRAIVDVEKLRTYVLNSGHPEGRHKARVFMAALGIDARDAEWLAAALREAVVAADGQLGVVDGFGARYTAEFVVERSGRSAKVRSAWIVQAGQDLPRLVTCFVV